MTDHIKAARRIWGESAILPLADLERFWAIAYRAGLEKAADICESRAQMLMLPSTSNHAVLSAAGAIRAHAQNQPKPLHDCSVS